MKVMEFFIWGSLVLCLQSQREKTAVVVSKGLKLGNETYEEALIALTRPLKFPRTPAKEGKAHAGQMGDTTNRKIYEKSELRKKLRR